MSEPGVQVQAPAGSSAGDQRRLTRRCWLHLPLAGLLFSSAPGFGTAKDWFGETALEREVFELTNQVRIRQHLLPLLPEAGLRVTAHEHSADMLAHRFFAHINRAGEAAADRVSRVHRRFIGGVGENILASSAPVGHPDTAKMIVDSWMRSPGHRGNILSAEYSHLGVGIATAGEEFYATQDFGDLRAYLEVPLPRYASRDTTLDLATTAVQTIPAYADLYAPKGGTVLARVAPGPACRVVGPRGLYRTRFYFPLGGRRFDLFDGPQLELR